MTSKNRIAKLTMVASLFCFALPAVAADVYVEPDDIFDNRRVLAACPSQTDIFQGISPGVDWTGFQERDLVILKLTDSGAQIIFKSVLGMRRFRVSPDDIVDVRQMSDCRSGDSYVLIGKDGGVKRRWSEQVLVNELFQTIDAMPMRRFEMRQQR